MANFCGKCGSPVEKETGLCPLCDSEEINRIKNTPNFCQKCGGAIDKSTGLCPNCDQVQETPIIDEAPKIKVKKEKKKGGSSALTSIATVLLSLCLLLSLLCTVLIYSVRNSLSEDNVEKVLDDVKIVDILKSANAFNDSQFTAFSRYAKRKFNADITEERLNSFINRSSLKSFAAEKISEFLEDFFEGDAELTVTKREVVRLIDSNDDIIVDKFGVNLNYAQKGEIADALFNGNEITLISSEKLEEDLPAFYYSIKILFSQTTLTILIIIIIFIMLVMLYNSFSQAVCGIAFDSILVGALGIIVTLVGYFAPMDSGTALAKNIMIVVGNIISANILIMVALIVIGIACLVARRIVLKIKHIKGVA